MISKLRKFYYRYIKKDNIAFAKKLGVRLGEHCQILTDPVAAFGTEPWLITLGNHVDVTIGVQFFTHEGGIWYARGIIDKYKELDCFAPITVGDNVMIGAHSLIMPGVHIGNNVIIGAHSVVTKDIQDGSVVAGVPAKPICTVDQFMEKLNTKELTPTKRMSQKQKKIYLKKVHPEWFND